jgi:hypothetical protein
LNISRFQVSGYTAASDPYIMSSTFDDLDKFPSSGPGMNREPSYEDAPKMFINPVECWKKRPEPENLNYDK